MKIPTYQQQQELVLKGYAKVSTDGIFDTFKYSRKVMYDYLWNELKESCILECRGHVYNNQTGELVNLPVSKSFNYLELDTWKDVSLHQDILVFKKFNGYMLSCTIYQGNLLVSTTGSTKSEYALWAKDFIQNNWKDYKILIDSDHTTLFEVVADWDKHIVEEPIGIFVLGKRDKRTGFWYPLGDLGDYTRTTLDGILQAASADKHEGWMIYKVVNNSILTSDFCKLKTDYYVGKKKLMRMKKTDVIWNQTRSVENQLPDCWKFAVEKIKETFKPEGWASLSDQQRRIELEGMEERYGQ